MALDRYEQEYKVVLPVRQERRTNGGFNVLRAWGQYRFIEPKLSKKLLRQIGGS